MHILTQKTPTSVNEKNVQIYKTVLQMNNNCAHAWLLFICKWFLFFFSLSLISLLLPGPLTLTSLFSHFFSLSASTLSALCFSHLISFLFHGWTHRSSGLCILSVDQSWVEWVSSLDAPGLWRSFHGRTVGGVDLVG